MARPKSSDPTPARLSVSLPAPEMTRLLRLKHETESRIGKPVSLAEVVRAAVNCLADERGLK